MEQTTVIIFMMFCMFFPSVLIFLDEKFNKDVKYIQTIKYVYVEKQVRKVEKSNPAPVAKAKKEIRSPLKKEAFDCLISLGMNKKDANQKVNSMFDAKNYQSIESFLLDAYKNA
jgi:Holliday junction resolvasome RuvABC DNA-binding subunit